jgi:hypothetical protein
VGCYVSSRSLKDGSLIWRRNVCSGSGEDSRPSSTIRHAVYSTVENDKFYTLENNGMLRIWNDTNGAMTAEFPWRMVDRVLSPQEHVPRIVNLGNGNLGGILSADSAEALVVLNDGGYEGTVISATEVLNKANVKPQKKDKGSSAAAAVPVASILGVLSISEDSVYLVAGWARDGDGNGGATTSFAEMALVEITFDGGAVQVSKDCKSLPSGSKNPLVLSSIHMNDGAIQATVFGQEDEVSYSYSKKTEESGAGAGISVQCENMTVDSNALDLGSTITSMHKLQCTQFFVTLLASTEDGKTNVFTVKRGKKAELLWSAEEGLASADSAIFLDKGVAQIVNSEDDEANIIASLSLSSRLSSQWGHLSSFVAGGFINRISELVGGNSGTGSDKDAFFGLNKVVVVLSNHFNKVFGLDTASNGTIAWTLELNPKAKWHKVVHGAASSRSSALGLGKHHPHSAEILILTHTDATMEWKCVDGLRGKIISEAVTEISSPVVQVIPVHGHSHANGGCKQNVILVLEDGSLAFLPRAPKTDEDSLYTHVVDKAAGVFRSMKVNAMSDGSGNVETVGETIFDPKVERIVNVAYPQRNEVVQSPSTILGDDSILLKYLNPHICVVVTEATVDYMEGVEGEENELYNALGSSGAETTKGKKKPVGATSPGETSPKQAIATPTLFVNLVDTVSGQVLHRASHAHTSLTTMSVGTTANVPVVVSENWIVYAFTNTKSRRTEIGVLTLYEGMIDKYGISAFHTPEQKLGFSSLAVQKPIVLAKTFAFNYPVSAIGVTNTKGGISSKNIILATGVGGKVVKMDRRLLDPRRPFGEPKISEKKEGLLQ